MSEAARRETSGAPSLKFEIVFACVFAALLAALCAPKAIAWLQDQLEARVVGVCLPPAEHEQLHVVVALHGGKIRTACMYVGTRGTYHRRAR